MGRLRRSTAGVDFSERLSMLTARAGFDAQSRTFVKRDLSDLAPRFRRAVEAALAECRVRGIDAYVYEALRSDDGQLAYSALARPGSLRDCTVGSESGTESWHRYGLAVDIASRLNRWDYSLSWIERVAGIFKAHGCEWGGDWETRDYAHFQWARCRRSPSAEARALYESGGLPAVWHAVEADVRTSTPPDFRAPRFLQQGDRGPRVMYVQRRLGLKADGVFGSGTRAAVRAFQKSAGLQVDGIVGPITAAAIAAK